MDLAVQLAILAALVVDYFYVKKKSLKAHAWLMTCALTANSAFILALMLPQFLVEAPDISGDMLNSESLLFLGHAVLGLFAEGLALFVVLRWILNGFKATVCKGKNLMRATEIAWVASVVLGLAIFVIHLLESA